MVKRSYKNLPDTEPEESSFQNPSEGEHLFQVTDVFDSDNHPQNFDVPLDVVFAKIEVVGGKEEGRTMLNRLTLDMENRGFFATRFFLKAIGEEYKGDKVDIDTDNWIDKQFYATVIHNGKYANISHYNMEKKADPLNDIWKDEESNTESEEESPL